MLSLYRTLSLRYLRQRSMRAVLIVASIALGVATLVATRVLNESMAKAAYHAVNPLAGTADLIVMNGEAGIPRAVVDDLRAEPIPGVREVTPLVIGRVSLHNLDNRSVWLLGVEQPKGDIDQNPWGLALEWRPAGVAVAAAGALFGMSTPVAVGSSLAEELEGVREHASGVLRVRAGGKDHTLLAVGTVRAKEESPAASMGRNLLVMRLDDAARLYFPPGTNFVTRIDLALAPDADRERVRALVEERVRGRGDVLTPEASDRSMRDVTAGLELGFDLGGAGALVVGLFLVYNALAVSVAERRHDIGIMRSLGATRQQVAGLFAGEAAFLGLVGAALGLPLGVGLAFGALGPIQRVMSDIFVPIEADRVHVKLLTLLAAALAGVVTALLAALVPSIRAAREEPADAVRRVPRFSRGFYRVLQAAASLTLVFAGVGLAAFREYLPLRFGIYFGLVLTLVGMLVAAPLLTAVASRLFQPFIRPFLGIEGRLAADNLARSPGRTGLVIGCLAAGVALMLQTAGVTYSSEVALLDWVDDRLAADLFVSGGAPITQGGQMQPLEAAVGRRVESELGSDVDRVLPVRFRRVEFPDPRTSQPRRVFVIAFDAGAAYETIRERRHVSGLELYPRLRDEPYAVLVSENFANLYGVHVGDTFMIRANRGPLELHVIGTVADFTWNRGTIHMDRKLYLEAFDDPFVDVFHVYVRDEDRLASVRDTITRRWGAEHNLFVLTRGDLRDGIRDLLNRLYGIAFAQEIVVGLVAVLGVVTALLISVLQRRRELGLLRAVGASRAQVVRSVLAEALLMGLIGAFIGVLVGLPLEWYVIRVLLFDEAGFLFPVQIPWAAAGIVAGMSVLISTLAGLGPAVHAMHLRIPEAIAYE